jgi:membrane-associated phospholipid phosphatase
MKKTAQIVKKNLSLTFSKKTRSIFLMFGVSFFVLFTVFTLIVREDILRSFDFNTTVRLQDDMPIRFDEFFSFLSVFGRFEFSLIALLLILLLKRKLMGIVVFGLFGFAHVVELIGKTILSQPGPPHMFLRTTHLSLDFPGLHVFTEASYPSGHALRAIFLSIILVLLIWKIKKIPAFFKYSIAGLSAGYVAVMLLSRVSLGEHWTTDVVGGALLGASFAFLSLLFL